MPEQLTDTELMDLFSRDKKAIDGVTFVLDGPNGVETVVGVDPEVLACLVYRRPVTLPRLTVQGRADRLRKAMLERELDGFVVVDLPSVRWLTGFTGSNGLAVISAEALVLATDGRYATQAPAQLEAAGSDATVVIASDLVASGADGSRVQPGLRSKATSSAGISSANGLRRCRQ